MMMMMMMQQTCIGTLLSPRGKEFRDRKARDRYRKRVRQMTEDPHPSPPLPCYYYYYHYYYHELLLLLSLLCINIITIILPPSPPLPLSPPLYSESCYYVWLRFRYVCFLSVYSSFHDGCSSIMFRLCFIIWLFRYFTIYENRVLPSPPPPSPASLVAVCPRCFCSPDAQCVTARVFSHCPLPVYFQANLSFVNPRSVRTSSGCGKRSDPILNYDMLHIKEVESRPQQGG